MPSSMYLQGADRAAYGVPDATDQQVQAASTMVDAFLSRPEGLVWVPDATGVAAYMAALDPVFTLTAPGAIAAGLNVVVPVQERGALNQDLIGEVLLLETGVPARTEACVVAAVSTTAITLASVAYPHAAGGEMAAGLVLMEERALPQGRSVTRVSCTPVARLLSGVGRYSYGRRSQQIQGSFPGATLLASVQAFGGPPMWTPFNALDASVSPRTGEVWVPAGVLLATFSDVRLRYVAGYPASGIPSKVKQATANIIFALQEFPELTGSIKKVSAGKTTIERFSDSLLDSDTRDLLVPFQASLLV